MREGVVAYDMASIYDLARDLGTLLHIASDEEKSRVHIVLREDFQQAQRVWIVGAVVVGERELLRSRDNACERAAVPLAGGRHGLISRGRQRDGGGCSKDGSEHGRN